VVDRLAEAGAVFVDELEAVPDGATVIYSAHGVSQAVRAEGEGRGLKIFDATCPLVTKVHMEVARYCKQGKDVVLIGHAGHPEVEGTLGQWLDKPPRDNRIYLIEGIEEVADLEVGYPDEIAFVTQTTLSVDDCMAMIDALKARFPAIEGPRHDDICYATQNRQDAVKELTGSADLILIVGSVTSSNSNRLREVSEKRNIPAYLIDGAEDIRDEWLEGVETVGVTAGASAPESLVAGVIAALRARGAEKVEELQGMAENMEFALPRELRITLSG
jgi:4-hydroxy-3-methylbut-2-enyl diphosphate reductase